MRVLFTWFFLRTPKTFIHIRAQTDSGILNLRTRNDREKTFVYVCTNR